MHGSRSRRVGDHPSEWSPTESFYSTGGRGPVHGHPTHPVPNDYYHHQRQQLTTFQEPSPAPGYFGGADPYQMTTNVALQVLVEACNQMAHQNSMPQGPPGLSGPPVNPHPLEQHGFPSFHAPSNTGCPLPPPSDISRGRWDPNDNPFLSRDRDVPPAGHFHPRDHRDNPRRDYSDHHNLPPSSLEARNGVFHHLENPSHWSDVPPLFGRDSETRDSQRQLEYHESFHGRSAEREYSGDRERGGRGYDTYGNSHHRSRPRSPKLVKERLGPTPTAEGRPGHHQRATEHKELGRVHPDVEIIEHRSQPSSALSQSRGRHSPPPVHHYLPPEHRPRPEDKYNPPYTVNERLGPPPLHPPPTPTQQPIPLFAPLAERLGGSPDVMARSVQARLGPPRITEPLDNNQGLVPFNTAAGPTSLLSRSEARSPLPDLRRELDNFNPMSSPMQSPQHLSSSSDGAVSLFRRSCSPSQHVLSSVRGPGLTSPTRRGTLSPIRAPSVSERRSPTPTPRSRPPSPPICPPMPTGRPPSPPKCPPSPSNHPPPVSSPLSRQHSLPTKHLQSPHSRSTSPKRHPSSRPISPVKHTGRHAQSPTKKSSKSPTRGEEKMGGEEQCRSRRSSKLFSPPLSPSSSRIKKHASSSSSNSRHSRSSPPPSSTSSRHSRRSSGKIKPPPFDSDIKKRTSSPRYKSRRSRSPSPTKRRSSSGNDVSSKLPSSSRRRHFSRAKSPQPLAKAKRSPTSPGEGSSSHRQQPPPKSKPSSEHLSTRTSSKFIGGEKSSGSAGEKVPSANPHSLPQRVLIPDPVHPLLSSTSEYHRHHSSSASMEEPSPTRTVTIEEQYVGMAESSSGAHPLQRKLSTSTAPLESAGVTKSKLDIVLIPGPSENRFLPPAPIRISPNDSPGPPGDGKSRDLSRDHHQEAAGELKFSISEGKSQKQSIANSCHSSSPSPSIPPLMDLNFTSRHIPQERSLFASSVSRGIPIAPGNRSNSTSSPAGSFVMDLKTSNSDIVSHSDIALPFSSFFETGSPRLAVGVSDSYLTSGPQSSPCMKKIAICSSESLDTHRLDVDTDSDNEGGLVIDESFVTQNGSEATSPEKDKSGLEHEIEKASVLGGSLPSSTTNLSDMEPPSSPDCEIISVSTVDSVPSLSAVSGSDTDHRATPESTASSELSKSSVLASISARHRRIMPASQRARKIASRIISTKLVEKLVEGDAMEQDLLRRFFIAVVLVTERLKWKHKSVSATPMFLSYYKRVFHGFVTGSLSQRENIPAEVYKQELKALKAKCGLCVSKWREHLQCYILRAHTLPKNKTDFVNFLKKEKKCLMKNVAATNPAELSNIPNSDSDRPVDPRKAKPFPLALPTTTIQHQAHSSSELDRPTDPRKAKPLSLAPPTLFTKALRSAFTPVISTSPPSTAKPAPSSMSDDSRTRIIATPKKPVTLLTDQSIHSGEHSGESCMFKPLSTASEQDQNDCSLFVVDRSADYSLDPELEGTPSGLSSHSSSSVPSNEAMVLVGEHKQDLYLPQTTVSLADEEQSLAGEKVSMDVVLSTSKEGSKTIPSVTNQPGPSKANISSDKSSGDDSRIKDDLVSNNKSSSKLDALSEPKASSVDLTTTSESCDSSTEAEDGEIISSSPSPAPSPPPERRTISPILRMAYGDPERWRRIDNRERELSQQRRKRSSHRSLRSRSSSPRTQQRGSSPERFYNRRQRRYRSRSRSWSRDRISRSHDRRRRSMSRDHRSRSRDRRSRDRRYHRSRSRSPVRRLRSQKSHVTDKAQRRASRSDHEKEGNVVTDSEDELEILKREALASMKQTLAGHTDQCVKSSTYEEQLRDGMEIDDYRERDMDLCSQSSGEEERGEGEMGEAGSADMELCSESSGERGIEGMSVGRDRETGKMEKRYESSKGNVIGDKDGSVHVVDGRSMIEVTFGYLVDAVIAQSKAGWSQQTDKLELTKEDLAVDYALTAAQDESSPSGTLKSQAEKIEDQRLTGLDMKPTSPAEAPVGRSVSAPSGTLGGKPPTHTVGSPMMETSLPAAMTSQQSVAKTKSSNQSSFATKVSQPSASKNNQPSAIATKISKASTNAATVGQLSAIRTTQPSIAKASTDKTSRSAAVKVPTAPMATNSQQTVAATKAKQPSTAKSSAQVKTSQAPSVKVAQPSAKASQPSLVQKASQAKTSQVPGLKATQSTSSSQASVTRTSQPSVLATAVGKAADPAAIKSLRKSLSCSSSRSGSKANSPSLSPTYTPSPGPSGMIDSLGLGGAVGGTSTSDVRARHRSGSCVKVLPSNKATWDIQRFLIINTSDLESESEAESSSSESDKEEATPPIASPELSEISKMILRAKAAAEENAQTEGQRKAQEESLNLPAPPASLTTAQKKEYLELQRKLALHAKKKALGATAAKTSSQAQASRRTQQQLLASKLKSGQNTKDKLVAKKGGKGHPLKKPVSAQVAAVKGKARSNSEPSILPMTEQRRKEGRSRNNTELLQGGQVRGQKGEESKKRNDLIWQQVDQKEVGSVSVEVRQKICEMEGTIQQHKSVIERRRGELTTLTHQLTDTISEIEELKLKMENLRKVLKAAEVAHRGAEQRRCELQDKVRSTRETIASTNSSIRQLERDVSAEREKLKKQPQPATAERDLALQASLRPPPIITEPVSDSEEQQPPPNSVVGHSSEASLRPPPIITEPISDSEEQESSSINTHSSLTSHSSLGPPPIITEPISDAKEQPLSSVNTQSLLTLQSSFKPPPIITEPISDTEEEQQSSSVNRQPSPVNMEVAENESNNSTSQSAKDSMTLSGNTIGAGRYELIVEAISDAEPDTSDVSTCTQQNFSDLVRLEHNYCSFEAQTQETTPPEIGTTTMPTCTEAHDTATAPSISNTEITSPPRDTLSQELEDSESGIEQVIAEVPQVLVYDTAAQEPEVDASPVQQTVSLMPKEMFKKRIESPPKKDKPVSQNRRSRKRRVSAQGKSPAAKRRPKNIQLLQRHHSLPASLDMQSPLGSALSHAINTALCPALSSIVSPDSYSSLTRSFQLPEVTHNQPTHSSVPSTQSTAISTTHVLQNGFSGENRVPEILTDLVTSLNTETLTSPPHSVSIAPTSQQGAGINNSDNNRVTGILSDLVTTLNTETIVQAGITSPPPVSSEQRFSSDGRISGIVNNLVTCLTSETIQNAGSATAPISADSANSITAVSAIQRRQEGMEIEVMMHTVKVEICTSPFSLPTDSEVNTLMSGCEASEEYESEEDVSRNKENINADSLFYPGSNSLFTLGPDEPPLFILPRLACAGDFPLEINPAAVSNVGLDMARQGIIHAPPSSELSSDITESELTPLELSELSGGAADGSSVADERVQSMVSIAKSQSPVAVSGRESDEQRASTPTLEELSQSTIKEPQRSASEQTSSSQQSLPTQQALSSDKERSVEAKKTEDSHQEKVKRSSSAPTKSVVPTLQAKPSSAKVSKSSKSGKQAVAVSKAAVSSGSKVKKGLDVSVGGTKQPSKGNGSGSGSPRPKLNVQMQLKMHMAKLEELKGHLASKKSTPQTTMTTESSTLSSKVTASSSPSSTTKPTAAVKSMTASESTGGSKLATAKSTVKPGVSLNSSQTTTKSLTGKAASTKAATTKKASATSKSGASTTTKPAKAGKPVKKQSASSSSQPTTSKSTTSKSPTPKPMEKRTVAGSSKNSLSADNEETTCARTMGYIRKTKASLSKGGKGKVGAKSSTLAKVARTSGATKKGTKVTIESAMSEIGKIIKAKKAESSTGTSASTSDVQTMSNNLNHLWQSNQQSLLERVPRPLPVVSSTAGSSFVSSHRLVMSLSPPAISEKFVAGVEKLDKPKKQTTLLHHSGGAPLVHKRTMYHPYSSPLLMFQSYRLNPLYRTNEKLALHSLSHSNKIDPNRIMCRFELGGICNDPACAGQHFKDITLDKEELIEDLVCYAPQLAGCDLPETDSESLTEQPPVAETKGKIATYATQMVERYSKKVSDEDLFKLTVHDVNKERAKLRTDPRAKASYISFDDRERMISRDLNSVSIVHPLSLLTSEPKGELTVHEGEGESEMEWDNISKELMPLGRQGNQPSSQKCRYFSFAEQPSPSLSSEEAAPDTSGGDSEPVKAGGAASPSPPSVTEILQSLSSAHAKGEGREALAKILKEALQHHKSSEELWIEHLRVQCSESSATPTQPEMGGATTTTAAKQKEKGQLFLRAMAATNSYNVALECIRLAEGYDMKLKCIKEVVKLVMKLRSKPHPLSSHQCLELIVNVCVLDELRGRPPSDTITAVKALPYYSDVLSILTTGDKQLLSLIYLHMIYTGAVPLCLLATPTSGPTHPARLASKESFFIEWSKSKNLSQQDYNKLYELFEESLILCAPGEVQGNLFTSPEPSLVQSCLFLYQNLVLFEAAYGDIDEAVTLLQHLVSVCPSVPELWALYARVLDEACCDWSDVLIIGTHQCPRSAELFHLAARLSLAHQSSNVGTSISDEATPTTPLDSAVQWLQQCVKNFYTVSPESSIDLELTVVLYRRLLGQMVPYEIQLPDFAEGVAPGNLGNQLAPLWLCYCLLVELTLPSSALPSSHSEFHHLSIEDAFESAIHSVHSPPSALHSLWMEYLIYLRSKALEEDDFTTFDNFKAFSSAVHRCLIAVDCVRPLPNIDPDSTQSSSGVHEDYLFHDQVVDVFATMLPPTSSFLLSQLQKFHSLQPRNPVLVARLVQCALAQKPMREDLAQTALATYLANNPHCDFLWRMAGAVEQRLGNVREARWIYHQAVRASPTNANLWKDVT